MCLARLQRVGRGISSAEIGVHFGGRDRRCCRALCCGPWVPWPPGACLPTAATASAAPSPTCASDLRECLRQSADLRETTFGGRYVTAEDVARCMEAFKSCISEGASRGGNQVPPTSSSSAGDSKSGLPESFRVTLPSLPGSYEARVTSDCRIEGESVSCDLNSRQPFDSGTFTQNGTVSGRLSGSTMTGSWQSQTRIDQSNGCGSEGKISGPATYVFSPDGTVQARIGPLEQQDSFTGSCSGSPTSSSTIPMFEGTGTWSPSG